MTRAGSNALNGALYSYRKQVSKPLAPQISRNQVTFNLEHARRSESQKYGSGALLQSIHQRAFASNHVFDKESSPEDAPERPRSPFSIRQVIEHYDLTGLGRYNPPLPQPALGQISVDAYATQRDTQDFGEGGPHMAYPNPPSPGICSEENFLGECSDDERGRGTTYDGAYSVFNSSYRVEDIPVYSHHFDTTRSDLPAYPSHVNNVFLHIDDDPCLTLPCEDVVDPRCFDISPKPSPPPQDIVLFPDSMQSEPAIERGPTDQELISRPVKSPSSTHLSYLLRSMANPDCANPLFTSDLSSPTVDMPGKYVGLEWRLGMPHTSTASGSSGSMSMDTFSSA